MNAVRVLWREDAALDVFVFVSATVEAAPLRSRRGGCARWWHGPQWLRAFGRGPCPPSAPPSRKRLGSAAPTDASTVLYSIEIKNESVTVRPTAEASLPRSASSATSPPMALKPLSGSVVRRRRSVSIDDATPDLSEHAIRHRVADLMSAMRGGNVGSLDDILAKVRHHGRSRAAEWSAARRPHEYHETIPKLANWQGSQWAWSDRAKVQRKFAKTHAPIPCAIFRPAP